MVRRRGAELAVGGGIALLALLLYAPAAGFWWVHDDFFQLTYVADHRPLDYSLDPAVWQRLPTRMLTPLLMLSLDADLALFGPRPRPFYLHQLAALALAAAALFALLRLWLSRLWAAAGAVLFLLGPPVTALASLLMVRHYVEGLLLAILAAAAFVVALRRRSRGWAVGSAALGFAAMIAKEVFVPLVLLLPLVPAGTVRQRWRFAAPHGAALALYAAYRFHLLGTLGGGYGWAVPAGDLPGLVARLPLRLAGELSGGTAAGVVAVGGAALAAVALAARSRRAALMLGAALAAALAPLVPVGHEMAPRYATVAWVVLAVAAAAAGARLAARDRGGRRLAAACLAVVAVAALVANRTTWAETVRTMGRLGVENRAALTLGPRHLLAHPLERPAAFDAMPAFAQRFHGGRQTAGRFSDDLFLCLGGAEGKRVWGWDAEAGRLVEIGDRLPERRRRHCGAVREEVPLAARLRPSDPVLWWRLGPYREGEYRFVFDDGVVSIAVPREGGYRMPPAGELRLRVRYQAPAGWVTYSPEIAVELASGRVVDWRREGAAAVEGAGTAPGGVR
jgi:hypothetical protein